MNRYRRPFYRLTLNGEDITPRINGRLTQLTLRKSRGLDGRLAGHDARRPRRRAGSAPGCT